MRALDRVEKRMPWAGARTTGRTSKRMWMTTNAKPYAMKGSTPDDPAVIAAIDLVRWELSLGT